MDNCTQGIVTHLLFQNQNFEVLDVRADGNCFYSMISVGLAFHNIFLSMKNVKRNIFTHMRGLWEAESTSARKIPKKVSLLSTLSIDEFDENKWSVDDAKKPENWGTARGGILISG